MPNEIKGKPKRSAANSFTEALKKAGALEGGFLGKAAGLASGLGAAYIAGQVVDSGLGLATEAITGTKRRELDLAEKQIENERKGQSQYLEHLKSSEKHAQEKEQKNTDLSRALAFIEQKRSRGMEDISTYNHGGREAVSQMGQIEMAGNDMQDPLIGVMSEIAARQADKVPLNPLLVAGIHL